MRSNLPSATLSSMLVVAPFPDGEMLSRALARSTTVEVEPVAAEPAPPPAPEDRCRRGTRDVCRELTIGGAVTLGLGLAGLGTGIALVIVGDEPLPDLPAYERAYRGTGAAIIPVSVVLVTVGTLLIVKAVRDRRGGRAR